MLERIQRTSKNCFCVSTNTQEFSFSTRETIRNIRKLRIQVNRNIFVVVKMFFPWFSNYLLAAVRGKDARSHTDKWNGNFKICNFLLYIDSLRSIRLPRLCRVPLDHHYTTRMLKKVNSNMKISWIHSKWSGEDFLVKGEKETMINEIILFE